MTQTITSPTNPRVKRLVRLRNRRARDQEGVFIIEGFRELSQAAHTQIEIQEIYICPDLYLGKNEPALVERLIASGAELYHLDEQPFRKVAYRDRPEGLLAVAPQFSTSLANLTFIPPGIVLVAEGIEKPGNLGTMLRTADAAGVGAVVAADPRTDPFNPNVVRSSIGSLFTVPLGVATSTEAQEWLAHHSIIPVVTSPFSPTPHWEADLTGSVAIVVGSEQYGLSPIWLGGQYPTVRIPMSGEADSLNAAMAAGVVLFEAVRQRSRKMS